MNPIAVLDQLNQVLQVTAIETEGHKIFVALRRFVWDLTSQATV